MRTVEEYELECSGCGETVVLPAGEGADTWPPTATPPIMNGEAARNGEGHQARTKAIITDEEG